MYNPFYVVKFLPFLIFIFISTPVSAVIDEKAVLTEYERMVKDAKKTPEVVPSSYPGVLARTVVDRAMHSAEKQRNRYEKNSPIGAYRNADGSYTLTDSVAIIRQERDRLLSSFSNIAKDNIVINGNVNGTVISLFGDTEKIPGMSGLLK